MYKSNNTPIYAHFGSLRHCCYGVAIIIRTVHGSVIQKHSSKKSVKASPC